MGFCSTPMSPRTPPTPWSAARRSRGAKPAPQGQGPADDHARRPVRRGVPHGQHALEGMDSTESLDLLRQMTHDGEKEVSDEASRLAQREMRSALTPALLPFAAKLVAAMPAGWSLRRMAPAARRTDGPGRSRANSSFKHEGLRAVFPPGPASFTVSVIRSDYAGRLPKSDTTQPGGAYLDTSWNKASTFLRNAWSSSVS